MLRIFKLSALLALASLAGCASIPTGPSMMALPGSGRSFDQFRYDDYACRQFAYEQVGGTTPNQASVSSGIGNAAVGAGLGAAAGAALGGGRGAAGQDIRHSAERTRQWSTARRLVSMVEDMTTTLGAAIEQTLRCLMMWSSHPYREITPAPPRSAPGRGWGRPSRG